MYVPVEVSDSDTDLDEDKDDNVVDNRVAVVDGNNGNKILGFVCASLSISPLRYQCILGVGHDSIAAYCKANEAQYPAVIEMLKEWLHKVDEEKGPTRP